MPKVIIDQNRCKGCLLCTVVCLQGLLIEDVQLNKHGLKPVKVRQDANCTGCARCAVICPDCCIEVYK